MSREIKYNSLPDQAFEKREPGIYILKIDDVIVEDDDYGYKYVFSYTIKGTSVKINFDNCTLFNADKDSTPHTYGQNRLKTIIDASGVKMETIKIELLKTLIIGKEIKAELEYKPNTDFLRIKYANIYPLSDTREALNEGAEAITKAQESEYTKSNAQTPSESITISLDDDDY
jgi:hypothetical protein